MDDFLKLIVELWRLRKEKFRGQIVINFDGTGPKDIKRIYLKTLEEIQIDKADLADLKEVARKVMGIE